MYNLTPQSSPQINLHLKAYMPILLPIVLLQDNYINPQSALFTQRYEAMLEAQHSTFNIQHSTLLWEHYRQYLSHQTQFSSTSGSEPDVCSSYNPQTKLRVDFRIDSDYPV